MKDILCQVLNAPGLSDNLARDTQLLGNLPELDSMTVAGLIAAIEEDFDIFVEEDEVGAEDFETFGSLCDFVERLI